MEATQEQLEELRALQSEYAEQLATKRRLEEELKRLEAESSALLRPDLGF